MKYNKIFWLDDNPHFISLIPQVSLKLKTHLSLEGLLSRITFAYDFEMGQEITSEQDFELYILDADFPNHLPESRKTYINNYLKSLPKLQEPAKAYFDFKYMSSPKEGLIYDNFINFYRKCLSPGHKVIVYSLSDAAIFSAFDLGLPFYSKRSADGPEEIISSLQAGKNILRKEINQNTLSEWECGRTEELIERYLA